MEDVRKLLKQAFDLAFDHGVLIRGVEFDFIDHRTAMGALVAEVSSMDIDCALVDKTNQSV